MKPENISIITRIGDCSMTHSDIKLTLKKTILKASTTEISFKVHRFLDSLIMGSFGWANLIINRFDEPHFHHFRHAGGVLNKN